VHDIMTKKLILFDIDGTLILTGGAGARAMTRAFEATWGFPDALQKVDVAGRTDLIILSDALGLLGRTLDEHTDTLHEFRHSYCGHLRDELTGPGTGRPRGVLPGVRPLLDALLAREDVILALLTGNFPESAEIKLVHYDLWHYFQWGVYGDEAIDRHDLLPVALQRHHDRFSMPIHPSQVIIIGDTPHDVSCAQRGGAKAVAVATGNFDTQTLSRCSPDVVCEDLSDHAALFALLDRTR
jgi:phosphoglycolate phosphatase-like HAD superfamily hydrolase